MDQQAIKKSGRNKSIPSRLIVQYFCDFNTGVGEGNVRYNCLNFLRRVMEKTPLASPLRRDEKRDTLHHDTIMAQLDSSRLLNLFHAVWWSENGRYRPR
ncbi:MAG: hypothetical protein M5U34_17575 [Chloroflexi bacterium]|nr:hypothetical protein [Chloroflexota bacterium]